MPLIENFFVFHRGVIRKELMTNMKVNTKKTFMIFCSLIILAIAMLFALGCSSQPTLSEIENLATITAPSPIIATHTVFETHTKTPLPVNTLTAPEREKFVRDTISKNPSCKLPCWWGITPGETTWKETEELLQHLGVRIGEIPGYSLNAILHGAGGFDFEGVSIKNGFSFEETNGIVDAILINSDGYNNLEEFQILWKNYSPKRILEAYGPPDRIWLNVTEVYASARGYHLWFFYDKMGFMIRYPGDVVDTPVLHICPVIEGMRAIDLSLQVPDSPLPLERFDAILEDIRLQTETGKTRALHSIQDATGLDEKQFYDAFMQEDPVCFDTPQDIWTVK